MSESGPTTSDPVDNAGALSPLGFGLTSEAVEPRRGDLPVVAHHWFEAVTVLREHVPVVVAWRFRCPFCGEERKEDDYREAYGQAYRHLAECEWTGRDGLSRATLDPF